MTRQTLHESTRDMEKLAAAYSEKLGLTDLRLVWNERRGYHLVLPIAQRAIVEQAGFIQIVTQAKKSVACSTEQLAQLAARAKEMIQQILISTEQQLASLLNDVRAGLHLLFRLGESVALVDVMTSFAVFVRSSGAAYARPKMADGGLLVLKQVRTAPHCLFCFRLTYRRMLATFAPRLNTSCCLPSAASRQHCPMYLHPTLAVSASDARALW